MAVLTHEDHAGVEAGRRFPHGVGRRLLELPHVAVGGPGHIAVGVVVKTDVGARKNHNCIGEEVRVFIGPVQVVRDRPVHVILVPVFQELLPGRTDFPVVGGLQRSLVGPVQVHQAGLGRVFRRSCHGVFHLQAVPAEVGQIKNKRQENVGNHPEDDKKPQHFHKEALAGTMSSVHLSLFHIILNILL